MLPGGGGQLGSVALSLPVEHMCNYAVTASEAYVQLRCHCQWSICATMLWREGGRDAHTQREREGGYRKCVCKRGLACELLAASSAQAVVSCRARRGCACQWPPRARLHEAVHVNGCA